MFSKDKRAIFRLACLVLSAVVLVVALAGCVPVSPGDGTATGDGTTAEGGTSGGGMLGIGTMVIYLVVIVLVFYFFMIRPEKKRKKKAEEMRNSLSVGDNITTIGGMVGKIVNVSDNFITFETGEDRVRIKIAKWGISSTGKDTTESEDRPAGEGEA